MIVTFGKYQGVDTNTLARFSDGRAYLVWGENNLKSDKWKSEFSKSLASISLADVSIEEQARLTVQHDKDGDADYDDILRLLRDEEADRVEYEKALEVAKKSSSAIFAKWSAESGKPVAQLQSIYKRFGISSKDALLEIPEESFLSQEAKRQFVTYVCQLQECGA